MRSGRNAALLPVGTDHRVRRLRSLFILSLPRSLSSEVYRVCCASLHLASPAWTTDGEILNLDRFAMQGVQNAAFPKFVLPRHGTVFAAGFQFLSHAFKAEGFCYKDVVQPFVAASWLREARDCAVLKIKPNIAHVAYAMLQRKWLYPSVAGRQGPDLPTMMVEGLLMAEAAIADVPGETVAFDDLAANGYGTLDGALRRLYPEQRLAASAPAPEIMRRRDEVLARRGEDRYRALVEIETKLRHGPERS